MDGSSDLYPNMTSGYKTIIESKDNKKFNIFFVSK